MSEDEAMDHLDEQTGSMARVLPSGVPSRIIEYFPPGGDGPTARDCQYQGNAYSKGAVVKMKDGNYTCTGDKDGTWKPKPAKDK